MSDAEEGITPSESGAPSGSEFEEVGSVTEGEGSSGLTAGQSEVGEDYHTEGTEGASEAPQPLTVQTAEGEKVEAPEAQELYGERSEVNELISDEEEEGFSEYEQSEPTYEEVPDLGIQPEDIEIVAETKSQLPILSSVRSTVSSVKDKEKSPGPAPPPPPEQKRRFSIDESDEELRKIPVPHMKPSKVIQKQPEPKYQLWPVKVLETENIYKIMEKSVPRFFPRDFPYQTREVTRRLGMLAQYLQRKVFQMSHDRRKLVTVVRYHQTNWNGHKAVVRWLWCMETDAIIKFTHTGEGFIVSAVVIGLYMD